jgi:CRP-like cAMP-binding protein
MSFANHFLDALPMQDLATLQPHLSEVVLARGEHLGQPGEPIVDIHMPIDAVLSVVTVMRDGSQVESRTIGRESGYGLLHALGSPVGFERMLAQVGGRSWTLPTERLREAARRSPTLAAAIVQHAQATLLQSAQAAACNALHSAERRLCRWLLMTQDRVSSEVLPLTQEHLSIMLGVQRTTVTVLASGLQARGLIAYARGRITVRDRPGLEMASCECYGAIRTATEAVLRWR